MGGNMNFTLQSPIRPSGESNSANNSENLLPKISLKGSVQIEWKRCGRPRCRCAKGKHLHGPYYYLRCRVNGKQRRTYIRKKDLEKTLLAVELYRSERPSISSIKASLKQMSD